MQGVRSCLEGSSEIGGTPRTIIPGKIGSIMEVKVNALIEEPERMLRNLFLIVPFLLLVHVTNALVSPKCNGVEF